MTLAVVVAAYSRATPGVNAGTCGGAERQRQRRRDGAADAALLADLDRVAAVVAVAGLFGS